MNWHLDPRFGGLPLRKETTLKAAHPGFRCRDCTAETIWTPKPLVTSEKKIKHGMQKEYDCILTSTGHESRWYPVLSKAQRATHQHHHNCSLPTIVASEPQNEIKHWHKEGFQLVLQRPKTLSHELVT